MCVCGGSDDTERGEGSAGLEVGWKRLEPRAGTCTSSYSCSSSAGVISLDNGGGFIDVGLGLSVKEVNGETTAVLQEEALLSVDWVCRRRKSVMRQQQCSKRRLYSECVH